MHLWTCFESADRITSFKLKPLNGCRASWLASPSKLCGAMSGLPDIWPGLTLDLGRSSRLSELSNLLRLSSALLRQLGGIPRPSQLRGTAGRDGDAAAASGRHPLATRPLPQRPADQKHHLQPQPGWGRAAEPTRRSSPRKPPLTHATLSIWCWYGLPR